ncbi:MAG TPA: hypothetical protein VGL40_04595 [Bacillota bacterium]
MRMTEIELLQLNEAMKGTEACLEKAAVLAGQCEDQEVRNMLERTQRIYQQHYDEMVRLVNESNVTEGFTAETRRTVTGAHHQNPGYTTPSWTGPNYGETTERNERMEGLDHFGNVRT